MKRSDIKAGAELTVIRDLAIDVGNWKTKLRKGCPITVLSVGGDGGVTVDSMGMKVVIDADTVTKHCDTGGCPAESSATDVIDETVRVYIAEQLVPSDDLREEVSNTYRSRDGQYVEWETIREAAVDCAVRYTEQLIDELYEQNEDYE